MALIIIYEGLGLLIARDAYPHHQVHMIPLGIDILKHPGQKALGIQP